jgi:hypothetical protein
MTKDEALKLALEALDCICSPLHVREIEKIGNAMKVIKEVLAQPEQEPDDLTIIAYMSGFYDGKNKYAPRRTWVGLTEEEIDRLNFIQVGGCQCSLSYIDGIEEFAKDIEFKLREKNG